MSRDYFLEKAGPILIDMLIKTFTTPHGRDAYDWISFNDATTALYKAIDQEGDLQYKREREFFKLMLETVGAVNLGKMDSKIAYQKMDQIMKHFKIKETNINSAMMRDLEPTTKGDNK